jgi:hypothetical protein
VSLPAAGQRGWSVRLPGLQSSPINVRQDGMGVGVG